MWLLSQALPGSWQIQMCFFLSSHPFTSVQNGFTNILKKNPFGVLVYVIYRRYMLIMKMNLNETIEL